MALSSLATGPIAAFAVVGLFVVTTVFFILNKAGYVRNGEDEEIKTES